MTLSKRRSADQGGLSLASLAEQINQAHAECESAIHRALDRAILCGESLIAAKAAVAHGQWLPWLATNCPKVPERTAQAYMRIARNAPKLKSATVAHLGVGDALKLLAEPRNDRPVDDPCTVMKEAVRVLDDAAAECTSMRARLDEKCDPTVESIHEFFIMEKRAAALGGIIGEWRARGAVAERQARHEFISRGLMPTEAVGWSIDAIAEYLDTVLIPALDARAAELESA